MALPVREGCGAGAAALPAPSHQEPALRPLRPLGATVIQIMNNYRDIKLENHRHAASAAGNDAREHGETSSPAGLGSADSARQRAGAARRVPERGGCRGTRRSWEERSLAEG